MMVTAFCGEVLDGIADKDLRERLMQRMQAVLPASE